MIAIKDMEIPKSCSECKFKANDYVCGLSDCAFSCNHFKERNYNCPLVEIITCKDCKHRIGCKCESLNLIVGDVGYCVNAERRVRNEKPETNNAR